MTKNPILSPLTHRQAEILDFIRIFLRDEGMPPTRAEIAEAFGFKSPNAVQCHLDAMLKKHAIRILPGKSRGIQIYD